MDDLVKRLDEEIIAEAFGDHRITDGRLAERLIRERKDAAARLRELEALVEKMPVAIIEPGEAGLFHATSPDIPGLFVSGESVAEVRAAIPVVARALLARMGGDHDRS